MANGIVNDPKFHMTIYDKSTYQQWFTPAQGFSVNDGATDATLRHVEKNIWYIYLNISGTYAAGANTIGQLNESFFGRFDVTGYVPAVVSDNIGIARFRTDGFINVLSQGTGTYATIQGFILTREV